MAEKRSGCSCVISSSTPATTIETCPLHGDFRAAPEAPKDPPRGNAELRERVAQALFADFTGRARSVHFDHAADVALAALGLDDLDAAVTRLAMAAVVPFHHAEAGLLAALTPPDTSSP